MATFNVVITGITSLFARSMYNHLFIFFTDFSNSSSLLLFPWKFTSFIGNLLRSKISNSPPETTSIPSPSSNNIFERIGFEKALDEVSQKIIESVKEKTGATIRS